MLALSAYMYIIGISPLLGIASLQVGAWNPQSVGIIAFFEKNSE